MAVDKLVDSTQLDTDLTSVANAIRTKGGTSAQLAFPAGFVSAIDAIPTGGGDLDEIDDFTGGNILAITSHGTEYIQTDFYPPMGGYYGFKIQDSTSERFEHYWGASGESNIRIGAQRNGISISLSISTATFLLNVPGYSTGSAVDVEYSSFGVATGTATKVLYLFRGYYGGNLESQISTSTFYGLNILDEDEQLVAKFVPWLQNGVACVKEIKTGTIYYNSGTGAFDYIDLEGVTHSA